MSIKMMNVFTIIAWCLTITFAVLAVIILYQNHEMLAVVLNVISHALADHSIRP